MPFRTPIRANECVLRRSARVVDLHDAVGLPAEVSCKLTPFRTIPSVLAAENKRLKR